MRYSKPVWSSVDAPFCLFSILVRLEILQLFRPALQLHPRPLPESRGTGCRRTGPSAAACCRYPEAPQAESISAGPCVLACALPNLAKLEGSSRGRSPGDRHPLASRRVPPVLAIYLYSRTRPATDLEGNEIPHHPIGDAPVSRPAESRTSPGARFVGLPRIAGLHHRYTWREAA